MKKILFILILIIPFTTFSQSEEYIDGRLIKTLSKSNIDVSTSLRAIQRSDGKYYTFDVSVSNGSNMTKLVKVRDFEAFIVTKKGNKEELEILSNKEYQEKKKKRGNFRAIMKAMGGSSAAAGAGTRTSTTNANATANTYGSSNTSASAYGSGGYAYGSANTNYNATTNVNATSTTTSVDGAAVYAAQQNEERKLREYQAAQAAAKSKWNDAYLKSNTLSPLESTSGLLNIKFTKGVEITLNVKVQDIDFIFVWDPEESEM